MRQVLFTFLLIVFASCVWASTSVTPTITEQAAKMQPTQLVDDSQTSLKEFFPNAGKNYFHLFGRQNYDAFVFAAIGVAISSTADDEIHDYFADQHPGQTPEKVFGVLGKPYVMAPAIGALLFAGHRSQNHRFHDFTYALAQAYTLNYGVTTALKYSTGRERPDHSNNHSFPSGHAADGFMLASVIHNFYGNKAGIFSYAFASLMATSRLKKDVHWFSDVVAGAAIGYIVGTSVCTNMHFHHDQVQLTMVPLIEPKRHSVGIDLDFRF